MTAVAQKLPKSFFQQKLNGLQVRLKSLQHFLNKAESQERRNQIQKEINTTTTAIKRTELDSCFSRLEGDE